MAAKIPVRFKRTAEAFEVVGRSKGCPESSSGSEHSPDDDDLFDRVNSFIQRDDYNSEEELPINYEKIGKGNYEFGSERDLLSNLLSSDDDDGVKRHLRAEIEKAYRIAGDSYSPEFKRRLMIQLRERGFDAGLCKSKWEKMGQISSGNYEYVDANVAGTRYIIEVSLAGQFEIARPSKSYTLLLELLPPIFVGNIEELSQISKIMCKAIKMSLKNMEMHMPPWRRYEYVKAKWSSCYRRTVNQVSEEKPLDSNQVSTKKRALVGFSALLATSSYYCRENLVSKVGHLAMAINGIR